MSQPLRFVQRGAEGGRAAVTIQEECGRCVTRDLIVSWGRYELTIDR